MSGREITLRCPRCLAQMEVPRDDGDPQEAVLVIMICFGCDDGDFHSPRFENADGSEVPAIDPEEQAS